MDRKVFKVNNFGTTQPQEILEPSIGLTTAEDLLDMVEFGCQMALHKLKNQILT
jgi:hypothetical protein